MQIKTENKKNELVVEMAFDKTEWSDAVDTVYKKNCGKYKVQGFRNGKAPRKIIEQQYGEGIFIEDAIHKLFAESFEKFLDDNPKIHLADYPHLDFGATDDGGIKMVAVCETDPLVKLGAYTGLEIKKTEIKVGEKEIDEYLNRMRESRVKQIAADKDYRIANGDIAVIDFAGSVDGNYFEGGTAKNYELEIGSHSFIDNFEEQLLGQKIGDKKDINVKFPENYGVKELAGQPAKFETTVNNILRKELPTVDDDFAKEVSEFNNLADYKKDIKKQMTDRAAAQSDLADEEKLFAVITAGAKVEIPDKMVEHHLDEIMEDMEHNMSHQGASLELYAEYMGTTVEKLREERREGAKQQVKMRLVMDAIIDKENFNDKDRQKQFKNLQEFLAKNNKIV
jgi:trigger factor